MTKPIISKDECKNQHEETNLYHLPLIRVERNFEKLPIWSPKPKRGTVFVPSKTIKLESETLPDGKLIQRKVKIVPSAEYGYPTVKTQEIWYVLLHLWWQLPEEEKKAGLIEFSRRQIIVHVLGKVFGEHQVEALEKSIEQLAATLLRFEYLVYDKEKDELLKEIEGFTLLTGYRFTSKEIDSDIVHDKCSVTLNPLVVSNLLAEYCKPILSSVILSIKSDIARLLYSKLDTQFSYHKKYEISTERFFREHGLEGKKYKTPSGRKQSLERAIKQLLGKPTSSGAHIKRHEFVRTADGKDWKLLVYSDVKAAKKNNIIDLEKKKKSTSETKKKPSPKPQKLSPEIEELLAFFDTTFHGGTKSSRSQAIVKKASSVIQEHGLPTAKYFVRFAHGKAHETKYKPATFNGIGKYLSEAVEEKKKEERIAQRHEEQIQQIHEENSRAEHKKQHEPAYFDYLLSLLKLLSYQHPEELLLFEESESLKAQAIQDAIAAASKKTLWAAKKQREIFERPQQKALRFCEFFHNHKTVHVPDFWQWDNQINSEK